MILESQGHELLANSFLCVLSILCVSSLVEPNPSESTPASVAQSTPAAADTSPPTLPALPSQNPQYQIPAPPCIPPPQTISNPQRAKQTSIPPAPPPAKPLLHRNHGPAESKNIPPTDRSHAPSALLPRRNAKPHPTAADETPRSSSLPAKGKSRSTLPALP